MARILTVTKAWVIAKEGPKNTDARMNIREKLGTSTQRLDDR